LLFGVTGLLSFGHALFVALGAYTAASSTGVLGVRQLRDRVARRRRGGPGHRRPRRIALRPLREDLLRDADARLRMLFYSFLYKFYALTGRRRGHARAAPLPPGQPLASFDKVSFLTGPFYYYSLVVLVLAALVMWRIVRSPFGLCLRSIRENPEKAEYLGVSVRRFRLAAFIVAGVFGAVGGALLAIPTGSPIPLLAYWTHSGNLVFMVVLGGFGHFFGPLVGAFVFIFLQDHVMSITPYWRFVFGAILALW
jgi:branched-chain amino acid transport system permease protein